jgi:hypothetical protein
MIRLTGGKRFPDFRSGAANLGKIDPIEIPMELLFDHSHWATVTVPGPDLPV